MKKTILLLIYMALVTPGHYIYAQHIVDSLQEEHLSRLSQSMDSLYQTNLQKIDSLEEKKVSTIEDTIRFNSGLIDAVVIFSFLLALCGIAIPILGAIQYISLRQRSLVFEKNIENKAEELKNKIDKIESHFISIDKDIQRAEKELKESINRKVANELLWINQSKIALDDGIKHLIDLKNDLLKSATLVELNLTNKNQELEKDILALLEKIKNANNRSLNNRIAFHRLHEDLINFCLHVLHTLHDGSSVLESLKGIYKPKFEEHSTKLGLYNDSLEKVYAHLQDLYTSDIVSKDLKIHLNHLDLQITEGRYSSSSLEIINGAKELVEKLTARIDLNDILNK